MGIKYIISAVGIIVILLLGIMPAIGANENATIDNGVSIIEEARSLQKIIQDADEEQLDAITSEMEQLCQGKTELEKAKKNLKDASRYLAEIVDLSIDYNASRINALKQKINDSIDIDINETIDIDKSRKEAALTCFRNIESKNIENITVFDVRALNIALNEWENDIGLVIQEIEETEDIAYARKAELRAPELKRMQEEWERQDFWFGIWMVVMVCLFPFALGGSFALGFWLVKNPFIGAVLAIIVLAEGFIGISWLGMKLIGLM